MPLFIPAPNRLASLAENALDEEQYDLAISCMTQMAGLGRNPSSNLLRSLVSISLCSLPRQSGSKKGSAIPRPMSRKTMERIGPTATMVIDARRLLERLGKQGLFDAIFDAILPVLSSKADDGNQSKNKRSRADFEDDDEGMEERERLSDSSPIGQFSRKMVECHNIWQILALGDMMDKSNIKARRQNSGTGRKKTQDAREGEESLRSNEVYDREGVWGVLEVFLQCWQNESGKRQMSSHFAEQFIEAPHRDRKPRKDRAPSTYLGEAFDVVYAGLSSISLLQPEGEEDKKSAKFRTKEEYRRKGIASSLVQQMFHLVKARQLDKQAVLRATANLIEKNDYYAALRFNSVIRREFRWEFLEAVMIGLGTAEESGDENFPLKEYQDCIKEMKTIKKIPKGHMSFLNEIKDGAWLRVEVRNENEMALVELFDGHHDKKAIAALAKSSTIKALLAEKWKMGKGSARASKEVTKLTLEQLSFAAAWRRATMQAQWKNVELKMEIWKAVISLKDYTKGIPSSTKDLNRLMEICLATILGPAAKKEKAMRECCEEMEKSYEQIKGEQGSSRAKDNGKAIDIDEETESEGEQEEETVDWKKEMRRHINACMELCVAMADKVGTT